MKRKYPNSSIQVECSVCGNEAEEKHNGMDVCIDCLDILEYEEAEEREE